MFGKGAWSREHRAESMGQRAESREQRAESREQRAESMLRPAFTHPCATAQQPVGLLTAENSYLQYRCCNIKAGLAGIVILSVSKRGGGSIMKIYD